MRVLHSVPISSISYIALYACPEPVLHYCSKSMGHLDTNCKLRLRVLNLHTPSAFRAISDASRAGVKSVMNVVENNEVVNGRAEHLYELTKENIISVKLYFIFFLSFSGWNLRA
jgi:hypothetical protein